MTLDNSSDSGSAASSLADALTVAAEFVPQPAAAAVSFPAPEVIAPTAPGMVRDSEFVSTLSHLSPTNAAFVFGMVRSELKRAVRDINSQAAFLTRASNCTVSNISFSARS